MGETKDETGLFDPLHQVERFIQRVGDRLVTDDIEAAVEGGCGVLVMTVVGSHDRDHIHAVTASGFTVEQ